MANYTLQLTEAEGNVVVLIHPLGLEIHILCNVLCMHY